MNNEDGDFWGRSDSVGNPRSPNLVSKTFNSLPAPWALGYPVQKNLGWGASSIIFPSWIVKSLAPPANPSILGKRGHKDFREVAAPGFNELVPIFSCFHRLKYLNLISTPLTLRLGGFSPSVHLFPRAFSQAARTLDFRLGALNAEEWLLRDCTLYQKSPESSPMLKPNRRHVMSFLDSSQPQCF